jgi:hypothetical protein
MSKLISLVSAQTVPNVLLIKHLDPFDEYIFISTERMESIDEKKSEAIINTCKLDSAKCKVIVVREDDFSDICNKLSTIQFNDSERVIVNMTGGTKIMSLATYTQLQLRPNIKFYYKNITRYEFLDLRDSNPIKIDVNLSVKDYLDSFGINYKSHAPLKTKEYSVIIFRKFIDGAVDRSILEQLRKHYRGKNKNTKIEEIINATEETDSEKGRRINQLDVFLKDIEFPLEKEGNLSKSEINYLTGGWLEEYVYFLIKDLYPNADVELGVELIKGANASENELDVVFCVNDSLCVIECKTSVFEGGNNYRLFNETIYKLRAVVKNFGLSVKSYLFTLDDLSENQSDMINRAKVMEINIAQNQDFRNPDLLNRLLPKSES